MKPEEALEILKSTDSHGIPTGYAGGIKEAQKVAVEALETLEEIMAYLKQINPVVYPRTKGWIDCIKQIYREHMEKQ